MNFNEYRGLNLKKTGIDKDELDGQEHLVVELSQFMLNNKIGMH